MFAIDIYPLKDSPALAVNDKSYQSEYLSNVKKSLEDPGVLVENDASFFNAPMLIANSETKDGLKKTRELHFLKNGKYYIISFVCEKKYFDEQWKDMAPRIKIIEFVN